MSDNVDVPSMEPNYTEPIYMPVEPAAAEVAAIKPEMKAKANDAEVVVKEGLVVVSIQIDRGDMGDVDFKKHLYAMDFRARNITRTMLKGAGVKDDRKFPSEFDKEKSVIVLSKAVPEGSEESLCKFIDKALEDNA